MSLLSYTELLGLMEDGVIENVTEANVNSSSIDLTLGGKLLYEKSNIGYTDHVRFMKNREPLHMEEWNLNQPYFLLPGEFVLAQSVQVFHLPCNISAEYKLKSSMARSGLEHLNAGWCDAGWNGSVLTLELKNMTRSHTLVLEHGMPIGQMVFFRHTPVPVGKSYMHRGRYNNDSQVTGVKE